MDYQVHLGETFAALDELRQSLEVAVAGMELGAKAGMIRILNSFHNELLGH